MSTHASITELLHRQHGLVGREQARAAGLTDRQVDGLVAGGTWVRVERGIYRHHAVPPSWQNRLLATCLATGGIASHFSAAAVWGLDSFSPGRKSHIVVPPGCWSRRPGARIREYTQFASADRREVDGIPVTGPAVTLLDLAGVVPMERLVVALDAARRRQLVDWVVLVRTLDQHARRGRNGSARFRELLDRHLGSSALPDSAWNRSVANLLEAAGLPRPELEHPVTADGTTWRLDLAYPSHRLGIELQSVAWHLDRRSQRRDARKLRALQRLGWTVYPFTWSEWTDHPTALVGLVAEALAAPPPPLAGVPASFHP